MDIDDNEWYYNACGMCNSKIDDLTVGDKCTGLKCGKVITSIIPRFRITVKASSREKGDDIMLVMFENIVANLIGKSSAMVLNEVLEINFYLLMLS